MSEVEHIRERYSRRQGGDLYSPLNGYHAQSTLERRWALVRALQLHGPPSLAEASALEIGCGGGSNLLDLIQLGFSPDRLVGNDLLADAVDKARARLPSALGAQPI